jgi:predicted ATPase
VYIFFEDKEGHRFGVQNISDGTLRFIAMSYLVIANRGGEERDRAVPLIMLEEPENGIYVGHLKPLFQKIEPSGVDGQFAFTSHNPYFIDLFDSLPEGLHVVRTVGNESKVEKPDPEKIRRQLGSFSVGDMHFRRLLV